MGSSVSLLWLQHFIPWRFSCGCLKLLPHCPCMFSRLLEKPKRFYCEHKRICPFMSLAILAFGGVHRRRSFIQFLIFLWHFFCSMKLRKMKMNIPQKWLNNGQPSTGYDSKLGRNIVKVIWIKMLILMLLARVWDVMLRAFEIPLMFPRTKS